MVQRVELVPASVRGYGNVVSPKVVGDFEVFNCSLSQVDSVYTMVYGAGEVSVALSVSPATVTYGQSVVLEATVLEDNNPLEGVTVQFFDGNSVLGTGTSDVNGVASLTVSDLGVGSHSINAQYDSESSNIVSVTVNVPYTDIVLTSDKDTLSFADGDSTNVYCQLVDGQGSAVSYAGETVTFEVRKTSDDSLVETLTPGTTNSSGVATTTMSSRGTGEVYIKSLCGLVSKTYDVEDCIDTILGESDQTSKFGSSISLRNNGVGNVNYDSTNQYYILNITTNGELFAPINSANGLNDFIIEFDGYLPFNVADSRGGLLGLTVYSDTNNWGRLGAKVPAIEYGSKVNGSYSETDISSTSTPQSTWIHYKFTITNNTVKRQMYNSNTLIYEDTKSYSSSWFTSSTKYGIPILWGTQWTAYFKNLKIKPL